MHVTCRTCGQEGSLEGEIHRLAEPGGSEDASTAIHLCTDCLDRREAERWSPEDNDGARLLDALDTNEPAADRRYSYLVEPEESIRLVRLRRDWVQENAATA